MNHKSGINIVTEFMESNPVNQLFVLESINKFAAKVMENKEQLLETMKHIDQNIVSGEEWIQSAENWIKTI
jgi:hypothetical protein